MPIILATQEVEIRRVMGERQPEQIVCKTLSGKNLSHKKRTGIGPEFKPQHHTHTHTQRNDDTSLSLFDNFTNREIAQTTLKNLWLC
jgi:hypothetical protein